MSRPQNSCQHLLQPPNQPLGPYKTKDPKMKSNSNVRIQRIIENKSCSTTGVDPKTVVKPYSDPQTSQLGPHKTKTTPKLSQIQMSEFRESLKMKVIQLH